MKNSADGPANIIYNDLYEDEDNHILKRKHQNVIPVLNN